MKLLTAITATFVCSASLVIANPAEASIESTEDVMTGITRHTLQIESDTTVSNSIGRQKTAVIIIRCGGSDIDAYVWTPTFNGLSYRSKPRVQTRWDGGKITSGLWGASKRGDAMFHPRPKSFIGELVASKTFIFGWQPYSTKAVAAKWNLQQHKTDIKKISALCGATSAL